MADLRKRVTDGAKVCSVCNISQPLSAFNQHRQRKDGLDSKCRECNSQRHREWYRLRQETSQRLYSTYVGMMSRCHSPGHDSYAFYGGRGIRVCDDWRNRFTEFQRWATLNGYHPELQLDRIDNDLGYFPDNCRFVTRGENNRNKRPRDSPLRNNARVTSHDVPVIRELLAQGITQREIAKRFQVTHATVWAIKARRTWADVA